MPQVHRAVRKRTPTPIVAATLESLEPRRLLSSQPGFPDTSFGSGGQFLADGTGNPGTVVASAIDADGRIYYLAQTRESISGFGDAFDPIGPSLTITRVLPEGALDTTWAQSGRFSFTLGGGIDEAISLHLLPDGGLIFVGSVFTNAQQTALDTVIGKVDADGLLDPSFATGGYLFTDIETYFGGANGTSAERIERTALAGSSHLVLYRRLGGGALFKLRLSDLAPEPTFGIGGRVDAHPGFDGVSSVGGLAIDDQGRIYQSARNTVGGTVFRRNGDGSLDTLFRTGGGVFHEDVREADPEVVVTPLGVWMVYRSGFFNVDGAGVRLLSLSDGSAVTSFGDRGFSLIELSDARAVFPFARSDGRVVVAVRGPDNSQETAIRAQRFDAAGQDLGFGVAGEAALSLPPFLIGLTGVIRDNDSFVWIPTVPEGPNQPNYLTAFTQGGAADTTFAPTSDIPGTLFVSPPRGGPAEVRSLVPVLGGYLYLQSELVDNSTVVTYAMRLGADGALEQRVLLEPLGISGTFQATSARLVRLTDGTVYAVLAGSQRGRVGLARFTAGGQLDLSYGVQGYAPIQFDPQSEFQSFQAAGVALTVDETQLLLASPLDVGVWRVNLDGSLPPDALVSTGQDLPQELIADADGGFTMLAQRFESFVEQVILRQLDAAGDDVAGFNGGVPLILSLPGQGRGLTLTRLASGQLAVGGVLSTSTVEGLQTRYFVALRNDDGTPVGTFGTSGIVTSPGGPRLNPTEVTVIAEDGIGGLLIGGSFDGAGMVFRLTGTGALDGNFGPALNTTSTSRYDRITGLLLDGDRRVIASGWLTTPGVTQRAALVGRLNAAQLPRPIASFSPPDQPAADATSFDFIVTYFPPSGQSIDSLTLGDADAIVELEGPGGTLTPIGTVTFLSFELLGGQVAATYRLNAPTGGFPSGLFRWRLVTGEVADSAGATNLAQPLGSRTYTFGAAVLSVTGVTVTTPGPFLTGSTLPVRVDVNNTGTVVQPSGVTVNLVLVFGPGVEAFLGTATMPEILAGGSATLDVPGLVIPPGISGIHRVRAEVGSSSLLSAPFEIQLPVPRVGGLDPNFGGGDGVAVTVLPGPVITTTASLSLSGGRLLSVGFNTAGDVTILRTLGGGAPDPGFGTSGDGRVIIDVRGTFDVATGVVLDTAGRYVIVGYSLDPQGDGATVFAIRLLDSGQLDDGFGVGGIALAGPEGLAGRFTTPRAVVVDATGGLLIAGATREASAGPEGNRAVVLGLLADGSVDGTFGSGGVALPAGMLDRSEFSAAVLLPDGRLLVGGTAAETAGGPLRFLLQRLDLAGNVDTRFGRRGVLLVPPSSVGGIGGVERVTSLTVTPDRLGPRGSVYVGGVRAAGDGSVSVAVVFRVNARGAVDRAFGQGIVDVAAPGSAAAGGGAVATVNSVVVQVEGRVLVSVTSAASAGSFQAGRFGVTLVRLDARGRVDPLFNQGQPVVVVSIPAEPAAAQPGVGSFDDFAQSRQGQATQIEGGAVRSIATRPTTGGTELRVAGIVPDGVDLSGTLVAARLGATVAPGFRTTAQLSLFNIGSLASRGSFSVVLVARPVGGGDEVVLRTLNRGGSVRAGATVRVNLPVALARTFATGEYTLLARLTPTFEELSTANNTAVREPNFVVQ